MDDDRSIYRKLLRPIAGVEAEEVPEYLSEAVLGYADDYYGPRQIVDYDKAVELMSNFGPKSEVVLQLEIRIQLSFGNPKAPLFLKRR